MKLYNTKSRSIESLKPLNPPHVTFYSCGPTVYDYTHIGHLRTFTLNDLLKKVLMFNGYQVKHVMNITDVGHLTGDDDSGEDKMEKGARKFGKSIDEIVTYFTKYFIHSLHKVNIDVPELMPKATDHIQEMIDIVSLLVGKGHAYETKSAVYFDVSTFSKYGKLSGQNIDEKIAQAREDVYIDSDKRNAADFALWFKRVGKHKDHTLHWDSPWGDGFPGWHIECSAMSTKYLGKTIDIHSGGVDHIPVHHENEIAQSECAFDQEYVKYWVHCAFLMVKGVKMSKSIGNLLTVDDITKNKIDPLSLRYLFLQTHYRQIMNFTWESLQSADIALKKLRQYMHQFNEDTQRTQLTEDKLAQLNEYRDRFQTAISNDMQFPQALAIMWEAAKSNIPSVDKRELILSFDEIFGLGLNGGNFEIDAEEHIPDSVKNLAEERHSARSSGDYKKADELRNQLAIAGYTIIDKDESYVLRKN